MDPGGAWVISRMGTPESNPQLYRDSAVVDRLSRVERPLLVLHGTADTLIDPSGGRRTADAIRDARFVEIEGMGHDYPAVFWDEWVGLVADHAGVAV